jgi:hypothetical protein
MMNISSDLVELEGPFCTIEASSKDVAKIDDADKNSAVECFIASKVLDTKRVLRGLFGLRSRREIKIDRRYIVTRIACMMYVANICIS